MRRSEEMGKGLEALVKKHRGNIANDLFSGSEMLFTDDRFYNELLESLKVEFEDEASESINAYVYDMDFGKNESTNRVYIHNRPYVVKDSNCLYALLTYNMTGIETYVNFPYSDKVRLVNKNGSTFGCYEAFEVEDVMEDKVGLQAWIGTYLSPSGKDLSIHSDLCDFDTIGQGDVIVRRSGTGRHETLFTKYQKEEYEKMFYVGDED